MLLFFVLHCSFDWEIERLLCSGVIPLSGLAWFFLGPEPLSGDGPVGHWTHHPSSAVPPFRLRVQRVGGLVRVQCHLWRWDPVPGAVRPVLHPAVCRQSGPHPGGPELRSGPVPAAPDPGCVACARFPAQTDAI